MKKINFIAEIASSHNGNKNNLLKIIKALNLSNCNFVKIQIFKNSNLCHQSSSLFKSLNKIEINHNYWKKVIKKIKKKIILEPFDNESYNFCKKFRNECSVKISSSENDNNYLIKDALKNFKLVFLNISGFKIKKIKGILKNIRKKKLILMYGYQAYPTKPKNLRLNIFNELKKLNLTYGYADHSNTDYFFETHICTEKAIDFGAKYIEKHICLKRSVNIPDYISSFEINDFNNYINFFKKKKKYFFKKKNISIDEKKYCKIMNKFAVLKNKVKMKQKININQLIFLRINGNGLNRSRVDKLIKDNKKFKFSLKQNTILKKEHFI